MSRKFLAIDYGDKRVGLSLAEGKGPALPFKVILNDKDLIDNIQTVIKEENISDVIVGLPHSFSGQENDRLRLTHEFINKLKNTLDINIDTIDEQLTSKLYEKMGVKSDIDKHAATAILDSYLTKHDF